MFRVHEGVDGFGVFRVQAGGVGGFEDVGDVVVAPVGQDGSEVGKVQGGTTQFALSDGQGNHREGTPTAAAVHPVVEGGIRDVATLLSREVTAQLFAKAETLDQFPPVGEGGLNRIVCRVVQDVAEQFAVIGIAGHHDRFPEIHGGRVGVATDADARGSEAIVAPVFGVCAYDTILQANQCVDQFENGARGLGGHYSPVEHGFERVRGNVSIVFADFGQDGNVDPRTGNHRKYFSGGGFYGDDAAHLVLHEVFPVLLEFCIDGGADIAAGNCGFVKFPFTVRVLDAVVYVPQVDVVAFLSAQFLFAEQFKACFPGVVTTLVFGVFLQVVRVHFRYIAQQVSTGIVGVTSDGPGDRGEAGEVVAHFQEMAVLVLGDLLEEGLALESDAGAVLPVLGKGCMYVFRVEVEDAAQGQGIKGLDVVGSDLDVVRVRIVHEDQTVPVQNPSADRVFGDVTQGVVVCCYFVLCINDLDVEKPNQDDQEEHAHPEG